MHSHGSMWSSSNLCKHNIMIASTNGCNMPLETAILFYILISHHSIVRNFQRHVPNIIYSHFCKLNSLLHVFFSPENCFESDETLEQSTCSGFQVIHFMIIGLLACRF